LLNPSISRQDALLRYRPVSAANAESYRASGLVH
jgi:hypothetical protein